MARTRLVNLANFPQLTAINLQADLGATGGPKIVDQCAEVILGFTLESGKTGHIILGGRYAGAFSLTPADATAMLSSFTTGAQWTALAAFLAAQTRLSSVNIRNISARDQPLLPSTGAGAPGTSASPSLPNEVALVTTFRTAQTGPRYRGRMYWPGWATNALGAGNVSADAANTAMDNWSTLIPTVFASHGLTHVLALPARVAYIGATGTSHPARPMESPAVTSRNVINNHWDSQRRRGLK
jgi:hypothetical protein